MEFDVELRGLYWLVNWEHCYVYDGCVAARRRVWDRQSEVDRQTFRQRQQRQDRPPPPHHQGQAYTSWVQNFQTTNTNTKGTAQSMGTLDSLRASQAAGAVHGHLPQLQLVVQAFFAVKSDVNGLANIQPRIKRRN